MSSGKEPAKKMIKQEEIFFDPKAKEESRKAANKRFYDKQKLQTTYCEDCNKHIKTPTWRTHILSKKHLQNTMKERKTFFEEYLELHKKLSIEGNDIRKIFMGIRDLIEGEYCDEDENEISQDDEGDIDPLSFARNDVSNDKLTRQQKQEEKQEQKKKETALVLPPQNAIEFEGLHASFFDDIDEPEAKKQKSITVLNFVQKKSHTDEEKILSLFDVSGTDCDFLSNNDIRKILTEGKVKKSLKKAKQILVGAGATDNSKTINKHTFRGLSGICRLGESKSFALTELSDEPPAKKVKPNTMHSAATPVKKKPAKEKIPVAVKRIVWNTYIGQDKLKGLCLCCGFEEVTMTNFECGHVKSEKNGGEVTVENLRPICSNCNKSMGSKDMDAFMKQYKIKTPSNWNGLL